MRCLVLGGSGYVGQHLCPVLAELCPTLFTFNSVGVCQMGDAHGAKMDLSDKTSIRRVMQAARPNIVINLAAISNLNECEKQPEVAATVNGCTQLELPDGVTHYIYVSSDIVFGETDQLISEMTEPNPSCVYGKTKLRGEEWAKLWASLGASSTKPGNKSGQARYYAIVRPSVVYGKKGLLDGTKLTFVQEVVRKMADQTPVSAFSDEIRSPTFVTDIVDLVKNLVMNASDSNLWNQSYNLGSEPKSRYEMAVAVQSALLRRNVYTDSKPVSGTKRQDVSFSYERPLALKYLASESSNVTRALRRPVTGLVDGIMQVLYDEMGSVMEDPFVYDPPSFAEDENKNPRLNPPPASHPLHFKSRCHLEETGTDKQRHTLFDANIWRELHGGNLHFGKKWSDEERPAPFSMSTSEKEDLRLRMDKEGFVLLEEPRVPWGFSKSQLAQGIHTCMKYGYHPVWMWASDELWLLANQMLPQLKEAFHSEIVLDCWTWFVDCQNPGWYPHRDRNSTTAFYHVPSSSNNHTGAETGGAQVTTSPPAPTPPTTRSSGYQIPGYITCWVPLTDVNPETGCLYCLPADRDIGYRATSEKAVEDYMVDPRLYRALPTNGAVLFSHRLLHWGSRPSAMAPNPRMSLFFAIARDDFEAPCFDRKHLPLPPMELRIALIAGHRLIYSTHVPLSQSDAVLMWEIVDSQKAEFHPSYVEKIQRSPGYQLAMGKESSKGKKSE